MKFKKYILWGLCIIALISYIEVKHVQKTKNNAETKPVANAEVNTKEADKEKTPVSGTTSSGGNQASEQNATKKLDITMIDTIPNTMGNSIGNLANGGHAARQGKWMYYTYYNIKYHSPIYRAMLDGETALKPLNEPGDYTSINVVGDWIYYIDEGRSGIFKMKTDGSERIQVINRFAYSVLVMGDWIYYLSPNSGISKIKTDGTGETLVINDPYVVGTVNILNNRLYYTSLSQNWINLYSNNLDGSDRKLLANLVGDPFIIHNDWIYYLNSQLGGLYKMKLDGSSNTKVSGSYIASFNISGDKIYYVSYDDAANIYSIALDGTNKSRITNNISSQNTAAYRIAAIRSLNIIDDTIFCSAMSEQYGVIPYKIKIDGSLDKFLN